MLNCVLGSNWHGEAGRDLSYVLEIYMGHEWKAFQHACAVYYGYFSVSFLMVGALHSLVFE